MKILTVSSKYPSAAQPRYATTKRNFVARLSREVERDGGTNDLIAICGKPRGFIATLKAHLRFSRDLYVALRRGGYDLIYLHSLSHPIVAVRLARVSRRLPLVFNVHSDDIRPSTRLKKFLKRLARPVIKRATLVIAPSRYCADIIANEFKGLDTDRIHISPAEGIDDRFYVPHKEAAPGRPFTIGYVSRLDRVKGWSMFIEAVSQLRARNINCLGVIAGDGPDVDRMLAMVKERGLDDNIVYRGKLSRQALPELYASLDLCVFPSTVGESLGRVALEAMAAGTPVVASRTGAPASYITDGVNGYLFEPGSVNALVDRLLTYSRRSPDTRAALSSQARATAETFRASIVIPALYNTLRSLVAPQTAPVS